MFRIPIQERSHWRQKAHEYGFHFHTFDGEPYWDETAYYQFTFEQIEVLEQATTEVHHMCMEVVERVLKSEQKLYQFKIPECSWDFIAQSWKNRDPSIYERLDFAYDGINPPKLYENNADTPTSLYEAGFWQWLWLEDSVNQQRLPRQADQFNSIQERLIYRFAQLKSDLGLQHIHFTCCKDSVEDRGTVQYLQDCAEQAYLDTEFLYIEEIGLNQNNHFVDMNNQPLRTVFKLYPWEYMLQDDYALYLDQQLMHWIEPPWKAILSNKALLPTLWALFPNHPNLLESYFDQVAITLNPKKDWVKKPIFSREGANVSHIPAQKNRGLPNMEGPYGEEGYIFQAYYPLPRFQNNHTLIGSWVINGEPAGIGIREDTHWVTQDTARFLPHIIL